VSIWLGTDPEIERGPDWSAFSFCFNNPIAYLDPNGKYPIITITKVIVGSADQRVINTTDVVKVALYKVIVTDSEDAIFSMTFNVTRDAWVDIDENGVANNVGFEPKNGKKNRFIAKEMPNGYPKGNGTEALKLYQSGSETVHAEPNQAAVDANSRDKIDVAQGIMLHVGGNYEKNGKNSVAASLGCFGVCNKNNSSSNQSNNYTNNIMDKIKEQAAKSRTNPGRIEVIIEKRTGNEYPARLNY
jgi:hypothetical protein